MKPKTLTIGLLIVFLAIFVYHALMLTFTQDDSFITYRYAGNFLEGHGLVFNPGERVEGYTNFLFLIILILGGLVNIDMLLLSKIIGVTSGAGIIILAFFWSGRCEYKGRLVLPMLMAPILLLVNSAFAYWSISGMETILFAFMVMLTIYLAARDNYLFLAAAIPTALIRPEGIMVFGLIILYFIITRRLPIKIILIIISVFAVSILPLFVFRIFYFGDWLPNPFYAKTSLSTETLLAGIDYLWRFLEFYGFGGAVVLLPLIFLSRLPSSARLLFFVSLFYLFYILFIGGDVLYGARFFMPVLAPLYLSFALTLGHLVRRLKSHPRWLPDRIIGLVLLALAATTFLLPLKWLTGIRDREIYLVNKMKERANYITGATDRRLTIACSTIGAFAYYSDLPVIDLLGLTDKEIAKNPQPAAGLESTWQERNYNIRYLMQREPDLILFSTDYKPSAPAERALFLSSKFRTGYYPVFNEVGGVLWTIYRRADGIPDVDRYYPDPNFINYFHEALNLNGEGQVESAYESALRTVTEGPDDFYLPVVLMGDIQLKGGNLEKAMQLYHRALEMSGGHAVMAAYKLSDIYDRMGDSARADHYAEILLKNNRLF